MLAFDYMHSLWPTRSEVLSVLPLICYLRTIMCTLKNAGLNTTQCWVNIGQNTCWVVFNQQMFNPTFWAVTQPLGLNNPIAGFIHILPSAGLYWTQHFLECGCLFYSILLFSHWMIPFMLPHHLTFNAKFEVLCISTIDVLNTQCVKYIIWHIMHWLNSFLSHRVCLYDF